MQPFPYGSSGLAPSLRCQSLLLAPRSTAPCRCPWRKDRAAHASSNAPRRSKVSFSSVWGHKIACAAYLTSPRDRQVDLAGETYNRHGCMVAPGFTPHTNDVKKILPNCYQKRYQVMSRTHTSALVYVLKWNVLRSPISSASSSHPCCCTSASVFCVIRLSSEPGANLGAIEMALLRYHDRCDWLLEMGPRKRGVAIACLGCEKR